MRVAHHVNNATVLDVCAVTDPDRVDIAAEDCIHPHTAVLADHDIPNDLGTFIDKSS